MAEATSYEPTLDDAPPAAAHPPCTACGAPLDAEDAFCPACGTPHAVQVTGGAGTVRPDPVQAVVADGEPDARHGDEEPQRHFRCRNCGAEVATDPDLRSYVCAFCDSTYVVEFAEESPRVRPEFVIGFAVTPDQARQKFRRWISENSWYRPGDLATAKVADKLRGIYLPFWSFSMLAESAWRAEIGQYWYETQTYTTFENGKSVTRTRRVRRTEWWPLAGRHHRFYHGYLVSGSRGLPQQEAVRIKPFHLPALKRYQPYFLAGWLAEEYSIDREQALDQCRGEFFRREQANVAGFMPGDTHRGLQVETRFSEENADLILLPVYLLSYRYGDKLYRFLINGQTGKVAGDKPISWRRILGTSALVAGGVLLPILLMLAWRLLAR